MSVLRPFWEPSEGHQRRISKIIKKALKDKFGENEGELQYLKLRMGKYTFPELDKLLRGNDSWTESPDSNTLMGTKNT